MNKKVLLAVCAIVLVLVLVFALRGCGAKPADPADPAETAEAAAQPAEDNASAAEGEETADEEEQVQEPVILEDEGDIEIIIPDDMESDGF